MYVVTGITGQVGGAVADRLLELDLPVRGVVRDDARGSAWKAQGCEIAVVPDATDAAVLGDAMAGTEGVFLMTPPDYDPVPGFPGTHRVAAAYAEAIDDARPGRVVSLSSVGAQVERFDLLNNAGIVESALRELPVAIASLRPAWFMENSAWDAADARKGRLYSFLQPLDHAIDMVSVKDIAATVSDLLHERWTGWRTVELRGPARFSARDIADAYARALGHHVDLEAIPRSDWERRFTGEGMQHPEARIAMLDGFNDDWITFEGKSAEQRSGSTTLESVVRAAVGRTD